MACSRCGVASTKKLCANCKVIVRRFKWREAYYRRKQREKKNGKKNTKNT